MLSLLWAELLTCRGPLTVTLQPHLACPLMASHSCHIKHLERHSGSLWHRLLAPPSQQPSHCGCSSVETWYSSHTVPINHPYLSCTCTPLKCKVNSVVQEGRPPVLRARPALINIDSLSVNLYLVCVWMCVCVTVWLCCSEVWPSDGCIPTGAVKTLLPGCCLQYYFERNEKRRILDANSVSLDRHVALVHFSGISLWDPLPDKRWII